MKVLTGIGLQHFQQEYIDRQRTGKLDQIWYQEGNLLWRKQPGLSPSRPPKENPIIIGSLLTQIKMLKTDLGKVAGRARKSGIIICCNVRKVCKIKLSPSDSQSYNANFRTVGLAYDIATERTELLTCFIHPRFQSRIYCRSRSPCKLFGRESPSKFREEQMAYQIFSVCTSRITNKKISIHLYVYTKKKSCSYLCSNLHSRA